MQLYGSKPPVVDHTTDKVPNHFGHTVKEEASTAEKTGATVVSVNHEFHFRKLITEVAAKHGVTLAVAVTGKKDIAAVTAQEKLDAVTRTLIEKVVKGNHLASIEFLADSMKKMEEYRKTLNEEFDMLKQLHVKNDRGVYLAQEIMAVKAELAEAATLTAKLQEPLTKLAARLKLDAAKVRALLGDVEKELVKHKQLVEADRQQVAEMSLNGRILSYSRFLEQDSDQAIKAQLAKFMYYHRPDEDKQYAVWLQRQAEKYTLDKKEFDVSVRQGENVLEHMQLAREKRRLEATQEFRNQRQLGHFTAAQLDQGRSNAHGISFNMDKPTAEELAKAKAAEGTVPPVVNETRFIATETGNPRVFDATLFARRPELEKEQYKSTREKTLEMSRAGELTGVSMPRAGR